MENYFPKNLDEQGSLRVVRRFQDWAKESATSHIGWFFRSLSELLSELFHAQLVTIWDNNTDARCLVLQSSLPERRSVMASHTLPIETSSTGVAIERRKIVFHPNILNPGEGRNFFNPSVVEKLNLTHMVSIPVFHPLNPEQVTLVINLCFDSKGQQTSPVSESDLKRLASDVSRALQFLMYKRGEDIVNKVRTAAASVKGIASLFDAISNSLQEITHCTQSSLFSLNEQNSDLIFEGAIDSEEIGNESLQSKSAHDLYTEEISQIISTCVYKSEPLVLRNDQLLWADNLRQGLGIQCSYMAVPITSAEGDTIGVLRCESPATGKKKAPSFSSLDFDALLTFSKAMAPSIERFLRVRQSTGLMSLIKRVSGTLVQAYELDTSLQRTIEILVKALHSKYGSIYLRDNGTDAFVLRAATEPMKHLIGKATYNIGVGITGTVASGQVLNFRSKDELRSHPNRRGKYYTEVWGADSRNDSNTLLGVPIKAGKKIIGVWKVENVHQTEEHPDPYYTDEDVQMAQVLSSFIAYTIQNYKQEERRLRQFTLLAKTIQIQQAFDEDEAISSVLIALEEAGFPGAVLSLYDANARQITSKLSSGPHWVKIGTGYSSSIEDADIRAIALRTGQEQFVSDSSDNPHYKPDLLESRKQRAQYVLPLRLDEELIGTLQIDYGKRPEPLDDEKLVLGAFAKQLAIAISRMRSVQQALELTNHIMASSRFLTAETLSAMAVHSLHHKLKDINIQLHKDIDRREIRQNEFLLKTLRDWRERLLELETDLKKVLSFVRAPATESKFQPHGVHQEIQASIDTWINYIHSHKCSVRPYLEASYFTCRITIEAFREIMAVLLINAVQAHAKQIDIKTYNQDDMKTSEGKTIRSAFCLECSDDGIGLPTDNTEVIFESTYTTKENHLGTGLGLFVARRLARTAGGDLEVVNNSRQSKGATFRLILTLAERHYDRKRD